MFLCFQQIIFFCYNRQYENNWLSSFLDYLSMYFYLWYLTKAGKKNNRQRPWKRKNKIKDTCTDPKASCGCLKDLKWDLLTFRLVKMSTYSRVHYRWNEVFFKILKKSSIVQKKRLPHMKNFSLCIDKKNFPEKPNKQKQKN